MDKGWKKYGNAHEVRNFQRRLQRHKKKAFDNIAREIVRTVIGKGGYQPNAPLTLLLKSGKTPLSDTGKKLTKAISTKTISKDKLFIGFTKTSKFYPQARMIHDGGSIKVSQRMRNMFFILWLVSKGDRDASTLTGRAAELWKKNQQWFPLAASTKAIRIPARPFMEDIFKDPKIVAKARREFIKAINKTLKEVAR